jgi:hypothetical protein
MEHSFSNVPPPETTPFHVWNWPIQQLETTREAKSWSFLSRADPHASAYFVSTGVMVTPLDEATFVRCSHWCQRDY